MQEILNVTNEFEKANGTLAAMTNSIFHSIAS